MLNSCRASASHSEPRPLPPRRKHVTTVKDGKSKQSDQVLVYSKRQPKAEDPKLSVSRVMFET